MAGRGRRKASELTRVNSTKTAEENTGRDNRTPFVGGTQMPTLDSTNKATQLNNDSKSKAEFGPSPSFNALEKTQHSTIRDQAVKMPSTAGMLPKLGAAMSERATELDPLVEYLQKHAEQLEVNLENLPPDPPALELASEPVDFRNTQVFKKKQEEDELLESLFSHYPREKASIV